MGPLVLDQSKRYSQHTRLGVIRAIPTKVGLTRVGQTSVLLRDRQFLVLSPVAWGCLSLGGAPCQPPSREPDLLMWQSNTGAIGEPCSCCCVVCQHVIGGTAGTASLTVYWVLWILGRETQIVGKDLLICWCVQLYSLVCATGRKENETER